MTVGGIFTAIIFGAIIGALGRLIVPGRQSISIWLTILVGVLAAIAGSWLGQEVFGWGNGGFSFPVALLQILLAAVGVLIVTSLWPKKGSA
ncbi:MULTISPECIES: GlsB/YeaQ/YmgE family stress response membrane protein [Thermomonospora]|uniref:Transglycosylase-associated protein n=1 Tax=Thermomonospora curvata (strain ATCC 19995 / DSM 43183 / JCM 3096 / KCTC 9072 / NBRC 15933 / NCIMB 10081 / Henssen B9) TaxID=471852 RepID=D1A1Y8_THECD|nr:MULTISPECIES: hypothetical protein [Thermomonospora]ACY97826.1 conserved hypothetical protein [Thermomonospora curvata DSM 43183]PKK14114.1 MAG: GlsB/YeaQ/YmgE family stress response membrane protein [Thermomonospora sp. CIF 1]